MDSETTPLKVLRERVERREFADAMLVEQTILRFCCEGDSFEEVKRKMSSAEVGRTLIKSVDDLFDEDLRLRRSKPSIGLLLADCIKSCLVNVFAIIQRKVQEGRKSGDDSTDFCLHDVLLSKPILDKVSGAKETTRPIIGAKSRALWLEIRAGIWSGRIKGAGWTMERTEQEILDHLLVSQAYECMVRLATRVDDGFNRVGQWISHSDDMARLLGDYCDVSNNISEFVKLPSMESLMYHVRTIELCGCREHLKDYGLASWAASIECRHTTLPSPSTPSNAYVPSTFPNSPLPLLPPNPFSNLVGRNASEACGLIVQPRICPPHQCSGRQPVESNYPLVEQAIMSIFGFRFMAMLLSGLDVDSTHQVLGKLVADKVGSLGVGTVEQRRRIIDSMPGILTQEIQKVELRDRHVVSRLHTTLLRFASILLGLRKKLIPCLCDLTHLCPELFAEIIKAKIDFDIEINRTILSDVSIAASRLRKDLLESDDSHGTKDWKKERNWRSQVNGFADFINKPLAMLLRDPWTRLAGFDRSLASVMLMGSARILEEAHSLMPKGDIFVFDTSDTPCVKGIERIVGNCYYGTPEFVVHDTLGVLLRETANKRSRDLQYATVEILAFYAAAFTIDPTDYVARLNCAATRLTIADDLQRPAEFSNVVYDCSMALYYGGPNYKAYYRRGFALTHLKMWDKAILDFERALALEPQNVFLKERLRLARMRRS